MPTTKFHSDGVIPTSEWIFVFGSNEKGAHGKGAAKIARVNFRAEYGVGQGRTASAYAIATKDKHLSTLPLEKINASVQTFLSYAAAQPKLKFFVTRVGCELAGYTNDSIAPMFVGAPENCSMPEEWKPFMLEASTTQA